MDGLVKELGGKFSMSTQWSQRENNNGGKLQRAYFNSYQGRLYKNKGVILHHQRCASRS